MSELTELIDWFTGNFRFSVFLPNAVARSSVDAPFDTSFYGAALTLSKVPRRFLSLLTLSALDSWRSTSMVFFLLLSTPDWYISSLEDG